MPSWICYSENIKKRCSLWLSNFKFNSFLCELFYSLLDQMGSVYPELNAQKALIYNVIKEEENSFFRTLEQELKEWIKFYH